MKIRSHISLWRWPASISGLGILLGMVLIAEIVVVAFNIAPPPQAFYIGTVTSAPFILGLIYGGYWLAGSDIPAERYGRLGRWVTAVTLGTVVLIFAINTTFRPITTKMAVGTIRWSAAIGGGIGLLLGIFQVRGVQQAVEAERVRLKKRQIEQERDHLDKLVKTISHDIQNPLHVAMGQLELARTECDSDHLADLGRAHEQIKRLIENFLLLAQEEISIKNPTRIDLEAIVKQCWDAIETEQATLVIEIEEDVLADRSLLQELFENLFRSMVKRGNPDLTVTIGSLANGIYIDEDSPGISVDELESVFNHKYATAEHGTGFGLSVAQTIIEAHGWEVSVTENKEGGARFEIKGITFPDK